MQRPQHVPVVQHWNRLDLTPPVRVDPSGRHGPTRHEVRRGGWRRTSQGLYVPTSVDSARVEQRIVEAAGALPAFGGVTGWAALRWLGARWCSGYLPDGTTLRPVCLAADDIRKPENAVLSEERLTPAHLMEHDGLMITIPIRSLTFEMRYATSVREAVVWFDQVAYDDWVDLEDLDAFLSSMNGWTGVPQLRSALAFVDENSWSPRETWVRLVWVIDADLPALLCNRPLFDLEGRHIGTPDLLDVEAGLVIQYDSDLHLTHHRRLADERRDRAYLDHGLALLVVTREDMRHRSRLIDRMRAVREAAPFEAESRRRWTTCFPSWWVPTYTVAQRRRLDDEQQRIWLRYRQGDPTAG